MTVALLFALFTDPALAVSAQDVLPTLPIVVIDPNRNYAAGTFQPDEPWLGLHCDGDRCEVRDADITVSASTATGVVDVDEPIDVLHGGEELLALFQGMATVPGPVPTWFRMRVVPYDSRQYTALLRLGRWEIPNPHAPLTLFSVTLPDQGGYRYHITDGVTRQFLFATDLTGHYGEPRIPVVHWVGDLNGDGRPDLLLSIPDDSCGFDDRLYLSSSEPGTLLIKAAQLSGWQSACGC